MPNEKPDYQCIRCGYNCKRKDYMYKHLFEKTKPCQGCLNDIELTDEIRHCIIKNRRYIIKKQLTKNIINQTINNYNTLNNFINQMDPIAKLDKLLSYQNIDQIDFEEHLDNRLVNRIKRLEDKSYRAPYVLNLENLLELINLVTKVDAEKLKQFSVLFDKKIGRLKIYRDKGWETFIEEFGIKEIVSLIKSYYLDTYELYLIRNLHADCSNISNRQTLNEHIEIYYKFIYIFDLMPTIFGLEDNEILGHSLVETNPHYLEEKYMKLYYSQKNKVKQIERDRIKKRLSKIVKENTAHNIEELNQVILEILKIDEDFRKELFETYQISSNQSDISLAVPDVNELLPPDNID